MGHSGEGASSGLGQAGTRVARWVLLDADRWLITIVMLLGLFWAIVGAGVLFGTEFRQAVAAADPIETTFQALLTGIITGVTIVVTINQLVLSQELGAIGDQRDRMEGAMAFRREVEETLGIGVSPADPASFLEAFVDAADRHADELGNAAEGGDAQLFDRIRDYASDLRDDGQRVGDRLEGSQFGTFSVLNAALDFHYSRKLHAARRLRSDHQAEMTQEVAEAIESLVDTLSLFGPAREHIKTLYFQWELINLSRTVLYSAIPALMVTLSMILYTDTPVAITGRSLGVDNLVWTVAIASTVALLPFVLLVSRMLRIATVAKRTLAIGPFELLNQDTDAIKD